MTAVELPLSEYVRELSVSNKRRYLEKISSGIHQDPYLIPASELRNGDFPPVTNTDIFNYLVLAVPRNGLSLTKAWTPSSTSFVDLLITWVPKDLMESMLP